MIVEIILDLIAKRRAQRECDRAVQGGQFEVVLWVRCERADAMIKSGLGWEIYHPLERSNPVDTMMFVGRRKGFKIPPAPVAQPNLFYKVNIPVVRGNIVDVQIIQPVELRDGPQRLEMISITGANYHALVAFAYTLLETLQTIPHD